MAGENSLNDIRNRVQQAEQDIETLEVSAPEAPPQDILDYIASLDGALNG